MYNIVIINASFIGISVNTTLQSDKLYPPGPVEPVDINATAESFIIVEQLVEQYGDICRLHSPVRKCDSYLINHPDYIKHVLIKNHQNYNKGVGFDRVKMLLGNGVIVSDGPFWRKQRRMLQPAFGRQVIAKLSDQIKRCNLELLETWTKKAERNEAINITDDASELALNIVLRSLLSDDLDPLIKQQGGNPFSILTDNNMARDMKLALKFHGLRKLILQIVMKRRETNPERTDFLAMFMDARDKDTDEPMTDQELLDEIVTMIVAGHETSAITLNWVWYFISQHSDVEQKVYDEVDRADFGDAPDFNDLEKLSYTKQVMEEALRMYPPVWIFTRKAIEDDHFGEYFVPAGTEIFIAPYFLHRNPEFWPDAEQYNPDRFTDEAVKQRHKQAYIPFSAGPRRCIGDYFATIEMQMHVGLMAKHFHMKYEPEQKIDLLAEINMRSKNPIFMQLVKR